MLVEINVLNPLPHQLITKVYGFVGKKKKNEWEGTNHRMEEEERKHTHQKALNTLMELK